MEDGLFCGPTSWSNFHGLISIYKAFGPSLGVDRMWPRGMAMHQNVNVMIFINVCPRRVVLKKKFKFDHSQVDTIYKLVIVSHKLLKISVLWILSILLHLQKALCHMTYVHALFYFFLYGYGWLELRNTRNKTSRKLYDNKSPHFMCDNLSIKKTWVILC
jgi:hypothetical protein